MSRTRTRSYADPSVSCTHQGGNWTGSCAIYSSRSYSAPVVENYVPFEWSEQMTDELTPNFYRRRAMGEIINNPFTRVRTEWYRQAVPFDTSRSYDRMNYCSDGNRYAIWWGVFDAGEMRPDLALGTSFLPAPSSRSTQSCVDEAVTGAFAKASEQDAQGLVILAEGEETIKSFVSIFRRLYKIGKALYRGNLWYLRKQLSAKELSDRWMEGRYAIRPVVYDMLDVIKALKRSRDFHPIRQTYRSGASYTDTVTQTDVPVFVVPGSFQFLATKTSTRILNVRSGVLAAIDAISEATIWGLDQPFQAMWELVPFSFVVDWFINVGKTIAAWSPKYGTRTLASWATVHDTVSQGIYCTGGQTLWTGAISPNRTIDNYCRAGGGFITKVTKTTSRIPSPRLPILPTWSVKLDAAKLLDLAIMASKFWKKEKPIVSLKTKPRTKRVSDSPSRVVQGVVPDAT